MCSTTFAFGLKGHTIVGDIADANLDPEVAEAVHGDLCGVFMSDVANWADEIHSDPQYKGVLPLHYIDVSNGAKTYQESAKAPEGDLVVATQALFDYLQTGDKTKLEIVEGLKNIDRKVALALLIHFYGDLHQPLHISGNGDRGGNTIKVKFYSMIAGNVETNIHSIWDEKLLDSRTNNDGMSYGRKLMRRYAKEDPSQWQSTDFAGWVDYSMSIREQILQFPDVPPAPLVIPGNPPPAVDPNALPLVSFAYIDKNMPILDHQLWLAGMRLAYAINQIYGKKP
jgi:hypothetical protein